MTWLEWYDSLAKPGWTPAPATIGLIWQILYPIIVGSFGFVFVQMFRGKVGWLVALPFGLAAITVLFIIPGPALWTFHLPVVGWTVTITETGAVRFATIMLKSWLSVLMAMLLVATTTFPDTMRAMRGVGIPTVLVGVISFMYRYLFVLVDEAQRLQTARESRSAGSGGTVAWRARVLGGMVGSLFIRSYERSERIYAAMLSRGYAGEIRVLSTLQWQGRDTRAALAWAAMLVGAALVAHLL